MHSTVSVGADLPGQAKKALKLNDILLTEIRPGNGRFAFVDFDASKYVVSTKFMVIQSLGRISPRFLFHVLTNQSALDEFQRIAESRSGTFPQITFDSIAHFPVPVPPAKEQEQLAALFDDFEERIALLRETNATLEGIAQALFKSWFVDFDPVRAKMEGSEPEGMDDATAALFPDSFEESELGVVPRGWAICSLDQHVSAERGLSYKGAGLAERGQGVPMHNLNSVLEGGGYKYPGIKFYNGVFKEKHLVNSGEIIVANTEQGHEHRLIGFPAIVPRAYSGTAIFSHHIYRVRLLDGSPLSMSFLYRALMTPAVREQIIGCANGSTVNMLKVVGLQTPKFVCPSSQVCKAYELIASPIQEAVEANVERVGNLTTLRDTLLPRLISGQLRVPEALEELQAA